MQIPFFQHDLGKEELDEIAKVFSGPILTTGETVAIFEREFASYLNCRHAIGVTSCTAALHIALLATGIQPGDEVITTPMTFVATSTAIIQAGAKPVFVDVEPDTGNLDTEKIEAAITSKTRAIVPVHLYGLMCDMQKIRMIADKYNLKVIEDSAHCIEGIRNGYRPGQLGDAACFSFYATKNITCGEGGAVVTNDDGLAANLKLLRLHGVNKTAADRARDGYSHWDMESMGWKYNMDNIQAAILLPQLKRIDSNLTKRNRLADSYKSELHGITAIKWPQNRPDCRHSCHLFTVWIQGHNRDYVLTELQKHAIPAMVNYNPIHLLTYFRNRFEYSQGDFPAAEKIGSETISLPLYPTMPDGHLESVINTITKIIGRTSR